MWFNVCLEFLYHHMGETQDFRGD